MGLNQDININNDKDPCFSLYFKLVVTSTVRNPNGQYSLSEFQWESLTVVKINLVMYSIIDGDQCVKRVS